MTSQDASSTSDTLSSTKHASAEHDALRVWLRLLSCTTLIENQVSSRLRSEFDTTLPRFDLMAQLARFPDGISMGELSQRLMVSGGNVTGITDNLERDGLVERITPPEDRRAKIVRLTAKGRIIFEQMATVHATWINDWMSGLTEQEQHQLYDLLGKLKQHISASTG
ncbi:MAG: MarR family transcriptional regulator [Ktedonobacteraceae bacterium]|nr:MarR family transcriptional regulator [Ktedonobacteraceae bacterium]